MSSPGAAASSTSSRHRSSCRSASSSSATRSIRCGRSTRPINAPTGNIDRAYSCRHRSSSSRPMASPGSRPPRARGREARGAAGRRPRPLRRCRRRSAPARRRDRRRDARDGGRDAAEVWAAQLRPGDRPGPRRRRDPARPRRTGRHRRGRRFLWRQADERRGELIGSRGPAQGLALDVSAAAGLEFAPASLAHARADLGIRAAERRGDGRWRPGAPGIRSAGTSRSCRSAAPPARDAVDAWQRTAPGSSSPATRRRASPTSRGSRSSGRLSERLPNRRRRARSLLVARSLNGGFAGGPDGLVFVTDRELFGTVRVRRPRRCDGSCRGTARAPDAGRPCRPHRSRCRPLRADAPPRWPGRGPRLSRAVVRGR